MNAPLSPREVAALRLNAWREGEKEHAYSIGFQIKSIDEDLREIEGIATTPSPDRYDDIVEPKGAEYKLPIPLLWQHNAKQPVGHVIKATVTNEGITVRCKFVKVTEPESLKDELDRAWAQVKSGLVAAFSIGFMPVEYSIIEETFAYRFIRWQWLELSCVTIPANADCTITTVKALDREVMRAALGANARSSVVRLGVPTSPGASGQKPVSLISSRGTRMKSPAEQIQEFTNRRAAAVAQMGSIMGKASDEGRSLDDAEIQEYDGLDAEIKTIDSHLVRLKRYEQMQLASATALVPSLGTDERTSLVARSPAAAGGTGRELQHSGIVSVRPNVEKGTAFTRYVMALAMSKGQPFAAHAIVQHNKGWMDTTPQVELVLRAAVAAGTTTDATWAAPLVDYTTMVNEFIELLRPATIIGRIPNLRRVPFNVRMAAQTSGSTAYWVGQGAPIPVSGLGFDEVTLNEAKAAGIVVLTKELVRSSAPSAEGIVREDLRDQIAQFLDVQFVNPEITAVANVSPGSITNGVTPVTPSGTSADALRADIATMFEAYLTSNLDPMGAVLIMSPVLAMRLSLMRNALDQPEFPNVNMQGGTLLGIPVITSMSAYVTGSPTVGHMIIMVNAREVLLADEGVTTIDASEQASLQMLDNPTNSGVGATAPTTVVSMFQTDSVAIKAVRHINWKRRRTAAVAYIRGAAYAA